MPIVTMRFKLPEEREEHKMAMQAGDYYSALWDFSMYLRNQIKYNNELTDKELETFEKIREQFYELAGELLND